MADRCPECATPGVYTGLLSVECMNPLCRLYVPDADTEPDLALPEFSWDEPGWPWPVL